MKDKQTKRRFLPKIYRAETKQRKSISKSESEYIEGVIKRQQLIFINNILSNKSKFIERYMHLYSEQYLHDYIKRIQDKEIEIISENMPIEPGFLHLDTTEKVQQIGGIPISSLAGISSHRVVGEGEKRTCDCTPTYTAAPNGTVYCNKFNVNDPEYTGRLNFSRVRGAEYSATVDYSNSLVLGDSLSIEHSLILREWSDQLRFSIDFTHPYGNSILNGIPSRVDLEIDMIYKSPTCPYPQTKLWTNFLLLDIYSEFETTAQSATHKLEMFHNVTSNTFHPPGALLTLADDTYHNGNRSQEFKRLFRPTGWTDPYPNIGVFNELREDINSHRFDKNEVISQRFKFTTFMLGTTPGNYHMSCNMYIFSTDDYRPHCHWRAPYPFDEIEDLSLCPGVAFEMNDNF